MISESLIENPSNVIINHSIDPIEFDKTANPELDNFNPSLPTEPNVPIFGVYPVGDNVQNLSDNECVELISLHKFYFTAQNFRIFMN